MAHKKGQGSTRNGRTSKPKYRGVKRFAGESVTPGTILVRQVGSRLFAGRNVKTGNDFTLFSTTEGTVAFQTKKNQRKFVHVLPASLL